jgi:broad-specificity NMP kinase
MTEEVIIKDASDWLDDEVRKIKVTILHDVARGNDLSVILEVSGKQKAEFGSLMVEYLTLVEKNEGIIQEVTEVIDTETDKLCALNIVIRGNQEMLANELHTRAFKYKEKPHA